MLNLRDLDFGTTKVCEYGLTEPRVQENFTWQSQNISVSNGFSMKLFEIAEEKFLFRPLSRPPGLGEVIAHQS